jgi:hypothetical protein
MACSEVSTSNQEKKLSENKKNVLSEKEQKSTERNLQARPKILKKIKGTPNQPIRTKKVG